MNMPTRRGPEQKEFLLLYSWDQLPPIMDSRDICRLLGIGVPTFRKMKQAGMIAPIPDFPPQTVRYNTADVARMVGYHLDKIDSWSQVPPVADLTYVRGLLGVSYFTFVEDFEKKGMIARIPGLSVPRYHKADLMRMAGIDLEVAHKSATAQEVK